MRIVDRDGDSIIVSEPTTRAFVTNIEGGEISVMVQPGDLPLYPVNAYEVFLTPAQAVELAAELNRQAGV